MCHLRCILSFQLASILYGLTDLKETLLREVSIMWNFV